MNKDFSLQALLALFSVSGIGATRMRSLISRFGTPQSVLKASVRDLCSIEGIDKITAQKIKEGPSDSFVNWQLKHLEDQDVSIVSFWDNNYPELLKRIYDPPAFLFIKGNVDLLNSPSIAIVGTRGPTQYGKSHTEKISRGLSENGITIISGFARGVDSIAHKAALESGGNTIAVLGNGIDIVYPAENKILRSHFKNNGLFISEYPFGTKPDAGNFPKRNRIISGLSVGILVTEAAEKSGALLTAMYALDQNKEIFALPGPVNSPKSFGPNNLIKQGAILVQDYVDILEELAAQLNYKQKGKKEIKPVDLTTKEQQVYEHLYEKPLHIDQIALKCEISVSEALTVLLTLELMGVVRQMAGKMFCRY